MPIIKAAKKALRSSARKRAVNLRRTRTMKGSVKEVRTLAAEASKEATASLSKAYKAIDKAAKGGIIKKNAASRMKSRLTRAVMKASAK
ncbi:MAG TPA: 30S ribosomal protein S20 [Candidatus Paceibacterota bacterium]|nr:30S ribosomal protein S20 [Candidatus Paceibacterota bacterium]